MTTNEMREYVIDFFDWFPVESRQQAVRSIEHDDDFIIRLYEQYKEEDRKTMEDIYRIFGNDPIRMAYFERRSPGLRYFIWRNINHFFMGIDPDWETQHP